MFLLCWVTADAAESATAAQRRTLTAGPPHCSARSTRSTRREQSEYSPDENVSDGATSDGADTDDEFWREEMLMSLLDF